MLAGLLAGVLLTAIPAAAQTLDLPGAAADAQAYTASLHARAPAGGSAQARAQADAKLADAVKRNDPDAIMSAAEARIALGNPTSDQWLTLARAALRRTPPDLTHALDAAWTAYNGSQPQASAPPLMVLGQTLLLMQRPAQAIGALEAAVERAPNDPRPAAMLADARRTAGLLVRRVATEPDADPARACLSFTNPPKRGEQPADWVSVAPPQPQIAITREGDQICLSGLPSGVTTHVLLRPGLPGEGGINLHEAADVPVAMANRKPLLLFDTSLFLLPRGQTPKVSLASTNLSAVKLRLVRLSERNIVPWVRNHRLGAPLESYETSALTDDAGRVVWEGSAAIPDFKANALLHTALPLPDRMTEPGLYALLATPGDGTPEDAAAATQMILRTDLAPTIWRGDDGLTVQVRSYADAAPRPGVTLRLLARNNDILAETTTGPDGSARFAAPLLRGEASVAPAAVEAAAPDDLVSLDLNSAAFDLSDRGVTGAPAPGPIDPFIWFDRGIYRPGETVQLMALLRDAGGRPLGVPMHVRVLRPNGQLFSETVPAILADGAIHLPVPLSLSAPRGNWSVQLRADPKLPPIATASFRVDAFVPDRMAVDLAPSGPLIPGQPYNVPLTARYLYGAPAAGLTATGTLQLAIDPDPFPALHGYKIGLEDETFTPDSQDLEVPPTDAQGHTSLAIALPHAPDSTHALLATIGATVNDPSGRGVSATAEVKLQPAGRLIGIKPDFDGGAIDADAQAGFAIAAIDPAGRRVADTVKLRLVRERPDWRLITTGQVPRYETVWRDEPLQTQTLSIPADQPLRFAQNLGFGRYRLEVAETNGLAATSIRFRAGWVASDSPDVPDKVDVSADRRLYSAGETARLHIAAPFAGPATLLILNGRTQTLRNIDVPAGGSDVDIPVDAAWGPGAYATVHVFHPGSATEKPRRAIGLAWIGIDPKARTLDVSFDTPVTATPRATTDVVLHTAPGAWLTLAAVDEGVLRLTKFTSPDPIAHYFGRRVLGMDIRDDWGRLIDPAQGGATLLHQGGGDGGDALPEIPQKVVALFTPPLQAGPDGAIRIPLAIPDFNGQVRLMAVAWQADRTGAAATDLTVHDRLIAEPLLPRFLAPGDEARLAIQLQNLDLPAGEAAATITLEGPLELAGPARLAASLAPGASSLQTTTLRATAQGRGVIHLDIAGPDGFHIQRDTAILVRPVRTPVSLVQAADLPPGASFTLTPQADRFLPGWQAQASFGGAVRYNAAALVQALDIYPLRCLEQATSRGLPLAFLPDGPIAGDDRAGRLQNAVGQVLDHQRFDGGFGLWSASDEAEPWLSAYATDFLLRAHAAGAAVPQAALDDALKFLADAVTQVGTDPADLAAQAYRLADLALAGQPRAGANRILAAQLDDLPTPLAKAQLAAALARSNDRPRAEAAFTSALATLGRKPWGADYGSALRDQVAIALLLKESGLLPDRLARLLADLPGADLDAASLNTQEQAWAAAAAAALGRDGQPARINLGGRDLPPAPLVAVALTQPAVARNLTDHAVWRSLATSGLPKDPLPAARNQMRVTRRFFNSDGTTLDLDNLTQNKTFILLLEGRVEDGQDHRAALLQGLPAGWEIAGTFAPGPAPGLAWLGTLSDTESQPASDDRYAAVIDLTTDKPDFRLAIRLRAVTPGSYELPGANLADMYRPGVYARQGTARIKVLPAS